MFLQVSPCYNDVIDYYGRHNDVNYTDRYNAGRPPVLDSAQIKLQNVYGFQSEELTKN